MRTVDASADVAVRFYFDGPYAHPVVDGYRPDHLIQMHYLTCGVHHYDLSGMLQPGTICTGTITFITPEAYPHCLRIGQKIAIQEGARCVGTAVVLNILNPLLATEDTP